MTTRTPAAHVRLAAAAAAVAFLLFPLPLRADLLAPNFTDASYVYVTGYDSNVRAYASTGALVGTLPVPAAPSPNDARPRGTAVDYQGRLHVYNGTSDPYVSTYDPATASWTHRTAPGLSSFNDLNSGAVASFGSYVFASDMATFGSADDPKNGVVRFNTATGAIDRIPDAGDVSDLTRGLDGLLYTLSGDSDDRTDVRAFNPYSLAPVKFISLGAGVRGIAVNAAGEIYGAAGDGTLFQFSPDGAFANALAVSHELADLDLAADGSIVVVDSWAGGIQLTTESLTSHTQIVPSYQPILSVSFATPAPLTGWKRDVAEARWTDPANWTGPVPNSPAGDAPSIANFGPVVTAPRKVALDSSDHVTLSTLNFDSPYPYTLTGGGTLTLDRPFIRPVVNIVTGQHYLSTRLFLAKPSLVTQAAGARFIIASGGILDLGWQNLLWDYAPGESPADDVRTYLFHGRNGGDWAGYALGAITAAPIAADSSHLSAIAYAEASTLGFTYFPNQSIDASTLILLLTSYGDANLDGRVDADDYALLDRAYARSLSNPHWTDGDFNYDGQVDQQDYLLIDATYAQSHALSSEFLSQREAEFGAPYVSQLLAAAPEPATLSLLMGTLLPLLRRNRLQR